MPVAHKLITTLRQVQLLTTVKDKDKLENRQGAVYTRSNAAIARPLTGVDPGFDMSDLHQLN